MKSVPALRHVAPETVPAGFAARDGSDSLLGSWNYYFVLKLLLFWRGLIDFDALLNLAFFALLALPVPFRWSRYWRGLRAALALPAAIALLYHDAFLPPVERLFSQAGVISDFSLNYMVELVGRFVSLQVVVLLAGALLALVLARRFIRINIVVLAILLTLVLVRWQQHAVLPVQVAAAPGSVARLPAGGAPHLTEGGSNAELNRILQAFYATEARRTVVLQKPDAAELPFDLLFIHVCSLSWDDMEAAGMQLHPLWRSFDIVFRHFNAAASYSGPAAVRLNRATCGQSSNDGLFVPAAEQCYLMPSLKRAGFDINFAMNHDGHFDDFLQLVRQQGVQAPPLPLTGMPIALRGFDDSAIYDDGAVLARWQAARATSDAPRAALYYNTITLHDGNRLTGAAGAGLNGAQGYKLRLTKLFNELEALMASLAAGSRRTVVVLIPEHGAALRGDRMQIAGLREIATPAITTVPVGIRLIDPGSTAEHDTAYVDADTSFLALSQLVARMLEKSPFGPAPFDVKAYVSGLPTTQLVSENQSVVMQVDKRTFWREDRTHWRPFAIDSSR